jgi:hypothetical protein
MHFIYLKHLYAEFLFQILSRLYRICKRLENLGINSKESIPPAYVAWVRIFKDV